MRVLKRFLAGGFEAIPRRTAPGRERTVTAAWEAELLRVIELDPHEVGQDTANRTTERLAEYLGQQTGIQVIEKTVRVYLHAQGQTEGQITRLKLIKRQGYGRAKFDLLRQRVLHAA